MKKDLVSIIILNWNSGATLQACLESALSQSHSATEIILVDNGSCDGSLEEAKQAFGQRITIIKNEKNLGFSEGVNIGIQASQGEFIALLNSDAVAESNWITKMVEGLHSHSEAGMAACKIYLADKKNVLDNTGLVLSRDGQNRCRGRLEEDQGQYDQKLDVLCPSGCAGMYRRLMLDKIGFFDQDFFAFGEDMEIGLRARLQGEHCIYIPEAIVHHKLSGSAGVMSPFKTFYVERNRMWILLKCFPLKHLLLSIPYSFLRYIYLLYGLFTSQGPSHHYAKDNSSLSLILTTLKCHLATLIALPKLWKKRRNLLKRSTKSKEFETWLKDYGISIRDAALGEVYK